MSKTPNWLINRREFLMSLAIISITPTTFILKKQNACRNTVLKWKSKDGSIKTIQYIIKDTLIE